jgi:hypothetical protein
LRCIWLRHVHNYLACRKLDPPDLKPSRERSRDGTLYVSLAD